MPSMRTIPIALFWLAIGLQVQPTPATHNPAKPLHGLTAAIEITEVVDGDTLDGVLKIPVRVRLLHNWAPELHPRKADKTKAELSKTRKLAQKSRDNLEQLAKGKNGTVWIPWEQADRFDDVMTFGRFLGHVWVDGTPKSLSQLQVEAGLASSHKGGELGK